MPRRRARGPCEGCRVRKVAFDADGATVAGRARRRREADLAHALRGRCDSGRDTLLANQFRCKEKNRKHNSSALYGHFRGARAPARAGARATSRSSGSTTAGSGSSRWPTASTSIGAVCWPYYLKSRTKPLAEFFADTIALCPALAERLAGRRAGRPRSTPPATTPTAAASRSGERYLLLGDAYAFIDPVFSSGVLPGDAERLRRRRGGRDDARAAERGGGRAAPLRPR